MGGAGINLRGLGPSATLVLLNGYRQTGLIGNGILDAHVDINSLAPTIAFERVEVLLDGASSLYGSDAVAGVVNFITRDDFTGTEIRSNISSATDHSFYEKAYTESFMVGGDLNPKLHVVAAFEFEKQKPLPLGETGLPNTNVRTVTSGYGFPGNFTVPTRNASGAITGSTTKEDPNCAAVIAANITTLPSNYGTDTVNLNGRCRLNFSDYPLIYDQEKINGRFVVTDKINDYLKFTGDVSAVMNEVWIHNQPSGPLGFTLVVPGTNPGNTFRAVNASGQPLYALPNPANPSQPLLDANGNAVLTATPTSPAGGVPFNENATVSLWRPLSTTNATDESRPNRVLTFRADAGFEGKINDIWSWKANYGYSAQQTTIPLRDILKANLIAGVNGTLGPNHNEYYNPFGNSLLVPSSSPQYNSPSVLAQIEAPITNVALSTLTTLDAVISGEPVQLWAGPLGVALGAQMRRESAKEDYDPLEVAGLLAINPIVYDFDGSDITYSYFGEVRLPVLRGPYGKVELSLSGRYETDQYTSSFNPKFSLTYNYKWITLLGSWGTSFVAPSIFQRQGDFGQGLLSVTDPLSGTIVQPPNFTVGSPNLSPEKSTAWSAGIKMTPTKALTLDASYWNIDFKNLLTTLTSQAEVNADPTGPDIIRDPVSNHITEILIPYINAGSLKTDGFDLDAKYKIMGGSLGNFTPFADASEFNSYDAQVTPTSKVIHGVGKDNSDNFGYPIAKWRYNTGVSWERFNQTADVIMRYTSRVFDSTAEPQSAHPQIRVDLQYSYDFRKFIRGLKATVGIENIANAEPNVIPAKTLDYWMPYVQDAFPRRVYLTLDYTF